MTISATKNDPALLRLLGGRAKASDMQPYLSMALFAMVPVRTTSIDTLGVDARWRMYWNPDFIMTLTADEVAGAWLHEVGHLLRGHHDRFVALNEPANREGFWNRAGDAAINADLRTAKIPLPKIKAVYPEFIPGAVEGMATEQMYRLILDMPEITTQDTTGPDLLLLPNAIPHHDVEGAQIIGLTRTHRLDRDDTTVTITADPDDPAAPAVPVTRMQVRGRNTLALTLGAADPGTYLVQVTTGSQTVTAELTLAAPAITLRPDHVTRGWTAPFRVTVVGKHTRFTGNAHIAVTNGEGAPVGIGDVTRVSDTYLTFDLTEQVPDGVYTVTVTDGDTVLSAALPIGLPHMDLVPASLPVGYGTPWPFAAVTDNFTVDTTTTFDLYHVQPLIGPVPVPDALGDVVVHSESSANFGLDVALDEGSYLVVATTGQESAVANLTIGAALGSDQGSGSGEGEGEGECDGNGEGQGQGSDDASEPSDDSAGQGSGSGDEESDADSDSDDSAGGGAGDGGSGQAQRDSAGSGSSRPDPFKDFTDCGSGAGGSKRPWERDDSGRGPDGKDDGSVDTGRGNLLREQTAREIKEASKSRGDIPGGWTRWADSILKPQVDWRKELRSLVRRTLATVAGMRDYTYSRPSRRAGVVPNVVLPAMRSPRPPRCGAVVDTSGSVSDKMLAQALGDIKALLKQITGSGGDDGLKIIACDAAAGELKSVRNFSDLTVLEGGGGTDMRVGLKAAAEVRPKLDLIVTFTDGETPWPEEKPTENTTAKYVAVLLDGDSTDRWPMPEWMHKIVVNPEYANQRS